VVEWAVNFIRKNDDVALLGEGDDLKKNGRRDSTAGWVVGVVYDDHLQVVANQHVLQQTLNSRRR